MLAETRCSKLYVVQSVQQVGINIVGTLSVILLDGLPVYCIFNLHIQAGLVLRQRTFLKKWRKSKTKLSFKTVYFLGFSGLVTSFCILCVYTNRRHMGL
jgi:hypothetical protein